MKIRHIFGGSAALLGFAGFLAAAPAARATALQSPDSDALTAAYQLIHFDIAECQAISLKPGLSASGNGTVSPDILEASAKVCSDAEHFKPILEQLALSNGFTLPDYLPYYLTARYAALVRHAGSNLGTRYLHDQISSHEDALAVFQDESTTGTNANVTAAVTQAIPTVQGNLLLLQQTLAKN